VDIKGIFTNSQITELQKSAEPATQDASIQSEGISSEPDAIEHTPSDATALLADVLSKVAQEANNELSHVADKQKQLLEQKEKLRELEEKVQELQDELGQAKDGASSEWGSLKSFFGDDAGVQDVQSNREVSTDWNRLVSSASGFENQDSGVNSKLTADASLRADLGNLLFPLDAMHGQPKNYEDLQQVVRDLQNLLNSTQIPNEEKLKLQAELNQLDQISHQMPIQPQEPDQNFQEGLQLLSAIRSDLSQYVT